MSSLDILSMGIRNLLKRKLRTILTVLGVIIGTASIIIMISLGIGVNAGFDEQMKNWGDLTIVQIYNWQVYQGYDKNGTVLDDAIIKTINEIEHVKIATPVMEAYYKFASGRYLASFSVRGIYPQAMEDFGYKIQEGEYLSTDSSGYQIVFTSNAAEQFMTLRERNSNNRSGGYYGGGVMIAVGGGSYISMDGGGAQTEVAKPSVDLLNDRLQMSYDYNFGEKNQSGTGKKGDVYKISGVGILAQDDDWEKSYYCIMPIDQVQKIKKDEQKWNKANGYRGSSETHGYEMALVKVDDMKYADVVAEKIKELGFENVYSRTEYINSMKEMAAQLQTLLAAIGAVSLFVAAIGIANTMITSIYERTKEIGVMKVIGAKLNDIGKLFLLESALIGLLGGIFGIGLSYGVSYVLNNVPDLKFIQQFTYSYGETPTSIIPFWLTGVGLAFSTVIGLISGFLPARRAMRISAIAAIRTD